ncbi:hypothetical protein A2533_01980 [Candidatus Falkowbacteria bacterium RIFOXYD2_FULL_35_9]|uniref:Uncharacterized protein n=1 Tax=Candidatus Falkowbacteria bacterium RIFOXYC2_FULL_36_12 TaxID=1798002 RepID=A0A1F5SYQ2_9BACT|nr:MAG: hypothetical protein A2300_00840 [Candidatus Falkowbacteria bacterium RIFOXYB2_FULL_35_7]OGF31616.1 MAG: hypothetical protein A2478_03970 [Candidatus Falkowbacteria bacterium RIFOXYC2_FULL_36_12]OGF33912.1 MAG: hypothetical protein A2223_02980 [Candidatus Falkowbacteria bacterium RIFOXYA2_FULL_35_8]OGF46885.1 MAG: hypothetical protein A2533_01980 [Candidatus Falkowbacteria bacterium RIFOXYD2_FULL_35_9]
MTQTQNLVMIALAINIILGILNMKILRSRPEICSQSRNEDFIYFQIFGAVFFFIINYLLLKEKVWLIMRSKKPVCELGDLYSRCVAVTRIPIKQYPACCLESTSDMGNDGAEQCANQPEEENLTMTN